MISQEELKSVVSYNPETGIFTWLVSGGKKVIGKVAGTLNKNGYVYICVNKKTYSAHRLAFKYMTGEFPEAVVDHINHIKNDNRWSNIRLATIQQNQFNRRPNKKSSSNYKGVTWSKRDNKYLAQAYLNGKHLYLGGSDTEEGAYNIYKTFADKHQGDFKLTSEIT